MRKRKERIRNLTLLTCFAAVFSVLTIIGVRADRQRDAMNAASDANEEVMATVASRIDQATQNAMAEARVYGHSGEVHRSDSIDMASEPEVSAVTGGEDLSEASSDMSSETTVLSSEETAAILEKTLFTVTEYESPVTMYASATVNIRSGAGTDYDKVGRIKWGSKADVTGETDNGWYEVSYDGKLAFVRGDFMMTELPGTPIVFVGDSRTVQMQMAVGDSDKAYIAKVGEGYSWFKNTALSAIPGCAGNGTRMIINFGVNDLVNVDNYIELVNSNIDAWSDAGIKVYYASVTPVGSYPTVNNAQIEAFNTKLKNGLDPRVKWIDGYSYLSRNGFNSGDGLHYTPDTYKKLYSYYLSVIDQI